MINFLYNKIIVILIFLYTNSLLAYELGNSQYDKYKDLLKSKNIALVVNQSSKVDDQHLIDYLVKRSIKIKKIFALEHGVRGDVPAGVHVDNEIDPQTGIEIVSLYGKKKKPSSSDLKDIDIVIFDIQDVGVRFFTYIASLGLIMESAAENNAEFIVMDRANPNNYIAGPVGEYKNFLCPYPIPLVYGLTIGELALMIKGENWRETKSLKLHVIKMKDYSRTDTYILKVYPSPNLRSMKAIYNYPSLALLEPSYVSIGRGTFEPFEVVGYPEYKSKFSFTPKSLPKLSKYPKFLNKKCWADKISVTNELNLGIFKKFYGLLGDKFITDRAFLNYLVGSQSIVDGLLSKMSVKDLQLLYIDKLKQYKKLRSKYLLY